MPRWDVGAVLRNVMNSEELFAVTSIKINSCYFACCKGALCYGNLTFPTSILDLKYKSDCHVTKGSTIAITFHLHRVRTKWP